MVGRGVALSNRIRLVSSVCRRTASLAVGIRLQFREANVTLMCPTEWQLAFYGSPKAGYFQAPRKQSWFETDILEGPNSANDFFLVAQK